MAQSYWDAAYAEYKFPALNLDYPVAELILKYFRGHAGDVFETRRKLKTKLLNLFLMLKKGRLKIKKAISFISKKMSKKLLIIIPSYNQRDLCRRCLNFLVKQDWQDFSILIKDDDSHEDYRTLIAQFPTLDITYERQRQNLGALDNMVSGLLSLTTAEFIMCLHEDDFLHPQYLERAIPILEKNSSLAFIVTPAIFFNPEKIPNIDQRPENGWRDYSSEEFTEYILDGNKFTFGSVIYRRRLIRPEFIDLKTYAALFDRPFLINILINSRGRAAVLEGNFYYYQNHTYPDKRWKKLTAANVFNLYNFYQQLAPGRGRALSSQFIFDLINIEPRNWTELRASIRRGREAGFVSGRRLGWKFLSAAVFIALLGKKNYYYLFRLIKG